MAQHQTTLSHCSEGQGGGFETKDGAPGIFHEGGGVLICMETLHLFVKRQAAFANAQSFIAMIL